MRGLTWGRGISLLAICGIAAGVAVPRTLARAQGDAAAEPPVVAIPMPTKPPKGAVVLFSGKLEDLTNNFYKRYTKDPANWTVDAKGVATPQKADIVTKQEYGDCFVHVEFHAPVDAEGKPAGHGNSGIGFMGRYEVQIFQSFGDKPDTHNAGALYDQKAARVIASLPATEWQTYDIFFRAPRFDAEGKVTEKARATVLLNGVVVQNNNEFNGPTGIQYGEFKGEVPTGPLILQGDHEAVLFRNVWLVPM